PRSCQTLEPEPTGAIGAVGEQLSPVIAGDLERSALPVGIFEWWVENPGPEPVTVGVMATFADPPGGPDHGGAPRRPHDVRCEASVDGVVFADPGDGAPNALR